jgi:hypothetical protein
MDQRGDGVAVMPHVNDQPKRGKAGSALKAGFLNKPSGRVMHNVVASSRNSAPSTSNVREQSIANGGKAKNGHTTGDPSNQQSQQGQREVALRIVPQFEAAKGPELIAMDTSSMHLQWQSARQLPVQLPTSPKNNQLDAASLPSCSIEYRLEMRMVRDLPRF